MKKCNWNIVFNLYFWTLPWKSNDNQNVNVLKSLDNMDFIKACFNIFWKFKVIHTEDDACHQPFEFIPITEKKSKITKVQNYSSITYCLISLFWHKTVCFEWNISCWQMYQSTMLFFFPNIFCLYYWQVMEKKGERQREIKYFSVYINRCKS